MNEPPPPGGWPNQPPGPNPGQPQYGPPTGQQPHAGQQSYAPQGRWPQQPPQPPPPKGGGAVKWLLVAIAVLLIIGVTIGATVIFTRGDEGGPSSPPTSGNASDIASANDTGPVSVITEEPTCQALNGIIRSLADVQGRGWSELRGSLGPVSEWTTEQRAVVDAVAVALGNSSEQMLGLAKQTPHRVVRELYEQFAAYGRAYTSRLAAYTPADNSLAGANVSIGNALQGLCNAIAFGSANRSLYIEKGRPPAGGKVMRETSDPKPFLETPPTACSSWRDLNEEFLASTNEWEGLDADTPASAWTPEQREVQLAALPAFLAAADSMEKAGQSSDNPVFEDFALLATAYARAYVASGEDYVSADTWLSYTFLRLNNAVSAACRSAGG